MQQFDSYPPQRRSGFPALRFQRPLEAEFRVRYATRGRGFLCASLTLGLALLAVACALDWTLRPQSLAWHGTLTRLLLMAPAAILALVAVRTRSLSPYLPRLLTATAAGFSAGGVVLAGLGAVHGTAAPVLEGMLLTLLIYLSLGLRFYAAMVFAVPIAAALAASVAIVDGVQGLPVIAFLLLASGVAGIASYRMEHAARTIYLEREIVNLFAGRDAATGIWNRRLFATHLQSIRRQANRDKRSLALLLIEIDRFEEFELQCGRAQTDEMLRRVAQTIMRGARRPLDIAARLGGAQFILALYDPERDYIEKLAAELREGVAQLDIAHGASRSGVLGISLGAALSPPYSYHDTEQLLGLAKQALRAARAEARDRIVVRSVVEPDGANVAAGPWPARETV